MDILYESVKVYLKEYLFTWG